MFTGITRGKGILCHLNRQENFAQIGVLLPESLCQNIQKGASISLDGVCLTVVQQTENVIFFDLVAETLQRTTFDHLKLNHVFNIERALKFGDEIGGHILSGHVMGVAQVEQIINPSDQQRIIHFSCDPAWMDYILPKGFIGINGASITIVDAFAKGGFSVHLIPETLAVSNLGTLSLSDSVNIELDHQTQTIVNTVKAFLKQSKL